MNSLERPILRLERRYQHTRFRVEVEVFKSHMGCFRAPVGFSDQVDSARPKKDSEVRGRCFLSPPTDTGWRRSRAQKFPSY